MPVDALPSEGGNLELATDVDGELRVFVVEPALDPEESPRHRPHFATCPEADEWRR